MAATSDNAYPTSGKGYWNLARNYMYPHNEAAIVSRCSDLAVFDQLLRQAELCAIRDNMLAHIDQSHKTCDANPCPGTLLLATEWKDLSPGGKAYDAMVVWRDEARPLLKGYQEFLNSSTELAARPAVEKRRLQFVQDFLGSKRANNMHGSDMRTYLDPAGDIVALRQEIYQDPVSAFFARKLGFSLSKMCGRGPRNHRGGDIRKFSGAIIHAVGSIFGAVSATGYLIAAIATLYHTSSILSRLAVIAAFSTGHAVLLCLFGSLSIESMNAISTFAAIEVIFIGTNTEYVNATSTSQ